MNSQQGPDSHLFLVRFWKEDAQEAQETPEARNHKEWCGRVQHVLSGEARTFHGCPELIEVLLEMAETDGIEARTQGGGAIIQEAAP